MCSKIISILFIIFMIQPYTVYASAKKPGATAANFLKVGIGARQVGMGEAFCALADDANAVYWNPAGLAQIKEFQLSAGHQNWFEDVNGGYLGYVQPVDKGAVGVSIVYLDEGEIKEIKKDKTTGDSFKSEDMGITVSLSQAIKEQLLIGANLKYIHQKIADASGIGFATDLGVLYKPTKCINMGIGVQNIGTKIKFVKEEFKLPLTLKTGLAYKNKGISLALDVNKPIDNDPVVSLGLESNIGHIIAFRLGYKYQVKDQKLDLYERAPVGLTAGFGFGLGNTYFLDYAYVPYGDLGETHQISLMMKLTPIEIPPEEVVTPVIPPSLPIIPEEKPEVEEVKPVPRPEIKPEVKPEEKPIVSEKPKEIIPIKPPELLPKIKPPVELPSEPTVLQKQIVVLVDEVIIWSGPAATYEKITTVQKGTKLVLLDDSKKWYYKVLLPDGTEGWICYVFVSK